MAENSPATLLLIPTVQERELLLLNRSLRKKLEQAPVIVELCGFGPITAAAQTARYLAAGHFQQVLLAGIAGTYQANLPLGTAWLFRSVSSWGIGAGSGSAFEPSTEWGFSQFPAGIAPAPSGASDAPSISSPDTLSLTTPRSDSGLPTAPLLLTCCAAAAAPSDVTQRLQFHPQASAEDMEGFGVGLACLGHFGPEQPLPLTIIRGISNQAGIRDKRAWQIEPALSAVAQLLCDLL